VRARNEVTRPVGLYLVEHHYPFANLVLKRCRGWTGCIAGRSAYTSSTAWATMRGHRRRYFQYANAKINPMGKITRGALRP
jgi:hypothetical protein